MPLIDQAFLLAIQYRTTIRIVLLKKYANICSHWRLSNRERMNTAYIPCYHRDDVEGGVIEINYDHPDGHISFLVERDGGAFKPHHKRKEIPKFVSTPSSGRDLPPPTPEPPPLIPRPDTLLKWAIARATGGSVTHGLACEQRRRKMDEWGWRGCWRERTTVWGWMVKQADLALGVTLRRRDLPRWAWRVLRPPKPPPTNDE